MSRQPLFDVSPDQIAALDAEGLRLLIARLCEAELRRRGFSSSTVLYGGNQIAADGGIDVRVELPADTRITGFIPRPATGFQAKADDLPAREIAKEMRPEAKEPGGIKVRCLRPSIRDLAAAGGAYVIVSSKGSTTDSPLKHRRDAMRAAVADLAGSDSLHLDFYDRTRMATWVGDYPGVALWVRHRIDQLLAGWRPLGNWSRAAGDGAYLSDNTARLRDLTRPQDAPLAIGDGIARLRARLSVPGGMVRLTGLSGTGKTRLLEALFDPHIGEHPLDSAHAIYVDIGHDAPQPSASQLAAQLRAEGKRAVLLLDNCPRDTHDAMAADIKAPGSRLSLITVDLDIRDDKPDDTDVFRLQGASEAVIDSLLEQRHPALSQAIRRRIAEFSDGNARIALLAARNVGPDTNLADLGDERLFEWLFQQRKPANDGLLQAAEALALVYSFDGETSGGDAAELPILARLAGIAVQDVQRAVGKLIRREIVQSRGRWRAILPQPLANWLAKRALENLPAREIADAFWGCGNPRLLRSFAHRLSYLHDSEAAQKIARTWLGPGGALSDLRDLAQRRPDIHIDLLKYLAPVAPKAALDLIERCVNDSTLNQLTAWDYPVHGPLMSLLRKLAWFPEHFPRATLLLSRFVQTEQTAPGRNRNTSDLEELFWPSLSGTRADAQQRLALVDELLSAPDHPSQESGMIALRGMLKAWHFISSSHDFSFGGWAFDYGWEPESLADYQNWYGGALGIATRLALSESPLRAAARKVIAGAFRGLWRFDELRDQLEATALALVAQGHWPEGWLEVRATLALDGGGMGPGLLARLYALKDQLAPVALHERLRSYVLTPAIRVAQPARWQVPEARDGYEQAFQAVVDKAQQLGREVGEGLDLLDGIWPDLFGPDAHQASWFGEGLAEAAVDVSQAWHGLLGHYAATNEKSRNPSLLGGFLRAAALRERNWSEGILDDAVVDPLLGAVFPLLQVSFGIDEAGIRRLIVSVKVGLAPPRSYLDVIRRTKSEIIPPAVLSRILLGVARLPSGDSVAAEALSIFFFPPQEDPAHWDPSLLDCGRKLLVSYSFNQAPQSPDSTDDDLATIANACLSGTEAAADAERICQKVAEAYYANISPRLALDKLIAALLTLHPRSALDCWLGGTEDRVPVVMWRLTRRDDRNLLGKVPIPVLLEWADQDPETRLPRLADVIPVLEKQDGAPAWSKAALALLKVAPDRAAMFQRLAERLRPSVWGGSLAVILEQRRPLIQPFLTDADPAVRQAAHAIDHALQREIAAEAEREVNRDERFE